MVGIRMRVWPVVNNKIGSIHIRLCDHKNPRKFTKLNAIDITDVLTQII